MAEADADTIRLSLTADMDLRPVVEVTIGVLARRWGLTSAEIAAARSAAGDAFADLARPGAIEPVILEVHAIPQHLEVRITHGGTEHAFEAPTA